MQVAAAKELDSAKCSGSMAPVDLEHGKSALKVAGERTGDVFWASPSNQRGPNMVGSTLIRWQRSKLIIVAVTFFRDASYFW